MNPEVSVIIRTYNRAHLLKRAISSVLTQSYGDFEAIIVDDGSVDNTESIIKEFNDDRIIFIKQKHSGAVVAANRGIKIARGQFIAFLDDDDEWLAEKLQTQMEVFKRESQITGVVYTGRCLIWEGKRFYGPPYNIIAKKGDVYKELLTRRTFVPLVCAIVRKECFEKVGIFDESLPAGEDYDLWIRVSKHYLFKYIPRPLVNVYVTPEGLSRNSQNFIQSRKILLRKYKDEYERLDRKLLAYYLYRIRGKIFFDRFRNIKKIIKRIVLKTTLLPALSSIYRLYYSSAVKILILYVKDIPEVLSIFIRRGFTEKIWLPGYSDIDLAIIIKEMKPADEIIILKKLWRKINFLNIPFPFLSIRVINERELAKWILYGDIRRFEFKTWKNVYERRTIEE